MTGVRVLADDLTGALDTAAEFVPLGGPLPVFWDGLPPAGAPASFAFDSGTRESGADAAVAAVRRLAPALGEASLAYKKVDSLLRGHAMAELAACLRGAAWDACVLAPAFPHQGRITRDGIQRVRRADGAFEPVADVMALLERTGVPARRCGPDDPLGPGVTVFDAATDADLRRVAALGQAAAGRVVWCGSAGLAQALVAQALPHGLPDGRHPALSTPVLGLFGSDQATTARQLAACGEAWVRLAGDATDLARLDAGLTERRVVLASLDLPAGLARAQAAHRIAQAFSAIAGRLPRPGTLLVAGGETLRGLCTALGATALVVHGQVEPGLPVSTMRGGRWDGVTVVSKSGAFGGPNLWRDLLAADGLLPTPGRAPEKASA